VTGVQTCALPIYVAAIALLHLLVRGVELGDEGAEHGAAILARPNELEERDALLKGERTAWCEAVEESGNGGVCV
jgi:hypothetical protein